KPRDQHERPHRLFHETPQFTHDNSGTPIPRRKRAPRGPRMEQNCTATVSGVCVTLQSRVLGIIFSPRSTCAALARAPRWADVLILSTLAAAAAGAMVMRTEVGQVALVDQWERTAVAFGRTVDDGAYARLQDLSERGPLYEAGVAILNGPIQAFAVSALIFFAFGGRRRGVTFQQVLSVVSHAAVI